LIKVPKKYKYNMPSKQEVMRIVIKTLGCKANRYESDKIQDVFGDKSYIADVQQYGLDDADIILVNTCTVTHVADRKSRQALSHLKKDYPNAKTIIFGCGANVHKEDYSNLPNVDYVVQEREDLYKLLEKLSKDFTNDCRPSDLSENRTRSLIKIQDGCNNFCTYCIIPFARGREKSVSLKQILKETQEKIDNGYKEIVLTGINIGMWKDEGKDLAGLIEAILEETDLPRLRLSSIEPQNYSAKFFELFQNKRFCPHLHVSLQSGSADVLKNMNRHYDKDLFTSMVESLRQSAPEIGITTDVIVGFPGETQELFEETLEYIQKMQFSKIHVFPYSKRKGTLAADMENQVPHEIKKERCAQMAEIEKQMRTKFYKDHLGTNQKVLVEFIDDNGIGKGFTPNYIKTRVDLKDSTVKANDIITVSLKEIDKNPLEAIAKLKP
jgi:threonylcarbamoyladenosine tRNA methylthiotransferase MtaB